MIEPRVQARKHASLLRPFVVLALSAVLLGGTLGLVYLLRLHLALGPVAPGSIREHGQVQVFGFLVPFVIGFATFVVPRIAGGRPLRPRLLRASLAACAASLAATVVAFVAGGALAAALDRAAGGLVAVGAIAAAWALAAPLLDARRSGASGRGYLTVAGVALVFLALAGILDGAGWWLTGEGNGTMPESVAFATWRLAIEGFAVGMAFAVSARMFPGFLGIDPRLAYPAPASARERSTWANRAFWLALGAWALGTIVGAVGFAAGMNRVQWASDIAFAAGALPFSARLGLGPSHGVEIDRTRDRWFPWGARWAYTLLALGAAVGAAASAAALVGAPVHAWWWDARRHLITLGFVMTLIATMAGRLAPGYAGRPMAWPALRAFALIAFPLAALLRAVEAVAGQWGPAGLLWISAASGPVALAGIVALVVSLGATLVLRPAPRSEG